MDVLQLLFLVSDAERISMMRSMCNNVAYQYIATSVGQTEKKLVNMVDGGRAALSAAFS